VEHLFSSDSNLKACIGLLFSQLDKEKNHLTPFDEAAREKALYSARDVLSETPTSKVATAQRIMVLGNLGEAGDMDSIFSARDALKKGKWKDSAFLEYSLLTSAEKIIARNPGAVNHSNVKQIVPVVMEGMDSKIRSVRHRAVSMAVRVSDNKDFTETFARNISQLSRNERTSLAMGGFAQNLRSKNPERVAFTSLVLDKVMNNSTSKFKKDLLKEATKHFVRYPPSDDPDTARDTTAILGKHFETLLSKEDKNAFKRMHSREKINRIIKYFHK